jgi:hypothetical protein
MYIILAEACRGNGRRSVLIIPGPPGRWATALREPSESQRTLRNA